METAGLGTAVVRVAMGFEERNLPSFEFLKGVAY